jgi:hypothetical protein
MRVDGIVTLNRPKALNACAISSPRGTTIRDDHDDLVPVRFVPRIDLCRHNEPDHLGGDSTFCITQGSQSSSQAHKRLWTATNTADLVRVPTFP